MIKKYTNFAVIALIIIFMIFFSKITGLYVDWLFFNEVMFMDVFNKTLISQLITGALFGLIGFLFVFINIMITFRLPIPPVDIMFFGVARFTTDFKGLTRFLKILGLIFSLLIGLFSITWGSNVWNQALIFINAINTNTIDPIFYNDIGFYLFKLPFLKILNNFAGFIIFTTLCTVIVLYIIRGSVLLKNTRVFVVDYAKKHLSILGMLFIFKLALGFYLDTFDILYSPQGVVFGAGYADVYGKLIALRILVFITVISAIVFAIAIITGRNILVLYVVGGILGFYLLGVVIYPSLLQNLRVTPNELAMERPFIEHHIKFTRFGYDLTGVMVRPFDVSYNLTLRDIQKNQATINNIRLWDETPLYKTFAQLQQIRTYYKFNGIDNDRYTINGKYRQVMLAARELSYGDLPSRSWINEKLVFTHGNGVAMSYVNSITKEGLPEFIIKDIPPVSSTDIRITQPEIYYGEMLDDYVIVNTKIPEFNYPTAEGNKYISYKGTGGVKLDSFFKRILFSMFFKSAKIVLSTEITDDSRIIYNRNVITRIQKIAPFLMLDSDPYIVISKEGKLFWIIDAYTVSEMMPYSKPLKNRINYMRNPAKIVVDAYNGTIDIYLTDLKDPVISVYKKIFPSLFKDTNSMSSDLKEHIRYPKDFFKVQSSMFGIYHIEDPKTFYNKEDLWEIPIHGEKKIEPYYLIMKFPDEIKEEYVLLLPYTPAKRDNLAAWFAARCDGNNYGKLMVYTFPRDRLVFGPRQIDARIDQDSYISQQLTLWGQRGSQVIRGRLIIIPVEKSLLYIQPLYLAAEDKGGLPELRRVIMAYENEVVMEEDLEACLNRLFSGRRHILTTEKKPMPVIKDIKELSKEAMKVFERAKEFQKQGNWAGYGEELKRLETILKEMTTK